MVNHIWVKTQSLMVYIQLYLHVWKEGIITHLLSKFQSIKMNIVFFMNKVKVVLMSQTPLNFGSFALFCPLTVIMNILV